MGKPTDEASGFHSNLHLGDLIQLRNTSWLFKSGQALSRSCKYSWQIANTPSSSRGQSQKPKYWANSYWAFWLSFKRRFCRDWTLSLTMFLISGEKSAHQIHQYSRKRRKNWHITWCNGINTSNIRFHTQDPIIYYAISDSKLPSVPNQHIPNVIREGIWRPTTCLRRLLQRAVSKRREHRPRNSSHRWLVNVLAPNFVCWCAKI